ncbi:hypothetical protein [Photobacterium carnosum]|uniref:hypothetical protein n=1 Tax=Photobacterium carnosum TaxID=2023717 RepID=UPI001E288725|nr:hypothetical protein [Photobacterium carnosum]MCD9494373.1 hypothetical protein [Photobacterium carnosum]
MDDKVINLPNRYECKRRIEVNNGKLRCEVSNRWIKFPEASSKCSDMDYLHLNIMTIGENEKDRKLCELIVDRDMLEKLLIELPHKDHKKI